MCGPSPAIVWLRISAYMEEQQLVLRWHFQEGCLARNLRYLFEAEVFTDVTLSVGRQSVRAHKLVLATCSPYFLQLFKGIEPNQHPVIILHNTSIEDLRAILSFIYRGQCIVSKSQLSTLLDVSKTLKIQGLCDMKIPEEEPTLKTEESNDYITKENDAKQSDLKQELDSNILADLNLKDSNFSEPKTPTGILENSNIFAEKPLEKFENTEEYEFMPPSLMRMDSSEKLKTLTIPKKMPKDVPETCKCFICGKYLSNQYNLRVHMETHDEAYHACQSCPHVSRSRDALRKHVSYRHPEEYNSRKRRKTETL